MIERVKEYALWFPLVDEAKGRKDAAADVLYGVYDEVLYRLDWLVMRVDKVFGGKLAERRRRKNAELIASARRSIASPPAGTPPRSPRT